MKKYSILIFDLDGTILNSTGNYNKFNGVPIRAPSLFPGAKETLWCLFDQYDLAIATSMCRKSLDYTLDFFFSDPDNTLFTITRTAEETKRKPDPLMLVQIIHELQIPVDKALMIGDSTSDFTMASSIGMKSVAVLTGVSKDISKADDVIYNITYLPTLLNYVEEDYNAKL